MSSLARLLALLLGRKCPLCRTRRRFSGLYCSAHTSIQITQYEESRR